MFEYSFSELLWFVPALYLTASLLAFSRSGDTAVWRVAVHSATGALALTLLAVLGGIWRANAGLDTLGSLMALLVAVLACIVLRFSSRYLEGEPRQSHYAGFMLFTLAAVFLVVLSSNLGIIVLSWMSASLGLHQLLTFYQDRKAALIAAHKKFIAGRIAELSLLAAVGLFFFETKTLSVAGIQSHIAASHALTWSLHAAVVLLVIGVMIKSAVLPVHGWLMQVMEAPTPVSALLHAGVVNLGGFVLLRLAGVLEFFPIAQYLLVVVGGLSAVLAGLVMMTRISIKVRLAWSTCAQMGFMLMECGLGLYDLALLHLIAHSLYKANAFLNSGETVAQVRSTYSAGIVSGNQTMGSALFALGLPLLSAAVVLVSVFSWQLLLGEFHVPLIAQVLLALGTAPLLWPTLKGRAFASSKSLLFLLAIVQLYLFWHLLFSMLLPITLNSPPLALSAFVGVLFLSLYALQVWLLHFPDGLVSRRLYPWAYAGFFFDERFTRLAVTLWPKRSRGEIASQRVAVSLAQFHGETV